MYVYMCTYMYIYTYQYYLNKRINQYLTKN